MRVKLKINPQNCLGCGLCQNLMPEVFKLTKEGVSSVLKEEIEFTKEIEEVVKSCPNNAIEIIKED